MLPTVRAQPTTFSPCWTKARATAAPMPPEAPVTSASRSRHRSMPALAMVRRRPPTSLGEQGTGIAELRPRSQGLGRSLTAAAAAAARSWVPLLDPPSTWPACGRDSVLSSTIGHIAQEGGGSLAVLPPTPAARTRPRPFRSRLAPGAAELSFPAVRGSAGWSWEFVVLLPW